MSITYRTASTQTAFVQYSATLGMMFLATESNRKEVERVKASFGEDWKKGFSGLSKDSITGRARSELESLEIYPATIGGYVIDVNTFKNEGASSSEYLRVVLEGDDGRKINLSLDLSTNVAQQLIRKLANVSSSEYVEIFLFATLSENGYANHWVSLKAGPNADNLQKVPGVDPRIDLLPSIDSAISASRTKDKKVLRAIREATAKEFHVNLLTDVVIPLFKSPDQAPSEHDEHDDQSATVVNPDRRSSTLASTKAAVA